MHDEPYDDDVETQSPAREPNSTTLTFDGKGNILTISYDWDNQLVLSPRTTSPIVSSWDDIPIEPISKIGASRLDGEEKSWEDDPSVQAPIGTASVQPLALDAMPFLTDPYILYPERYI